MLMNAVSNAMPGPFESHAHPVCNPATNSQSFNNSEGTWFPLKLLAVLWKQGSEWRKKKCFSLIFNKSLLNYKLLKGRLGETN